MGISATRPGRHGGRTRARGRAPGNHVAGSTQAAARAGRAGRPVGAPLVEQQRQRFMERWKEAMQLAEGAAVPEAAPTGH